MEACRRHTMQSALTLHWTTDPPAPETPIAAVSPAPWMGASMAAITKVVADNQVQN